MQFMQRYTFCCTKFGGRTEEEGSGRLSEEKTSLTEEEMAKMWYDLFDYKQLFSQPSLRFVQNPDIFSQIGFGNGGIFEVLFSFLWLNDGKKRSDTSRIFFKKGPSSSLSQTQNDNSDWNKCTGGAESGRHAKKAHAGNGGEM